MSALIVAFGVFAALDITRKVVDRLARWRHWRVGRWGHLLCIFQRHREECLSCGTDYRYVLVHPIRYSGTTRETARAIYPLCQRCYFEAPEADRLLAAGLILNRWRQAGVYGDGDGFDVEKWDSERTTVYSEIKAGL